MNIRPTLCYLFIFNIFLPFKAFMATEIVLHSAICSTLVRFLPGASQLRIAGHRTNKYLRWAGQTVYHSNSKELSRRQTPDSTRRLLYPNGNPYTR